MLDSVALSLGGVGGVEDKTKTARNSLNQTYDQFLTLLTTQLKNQDPLNPMDSKDFTNQLISLAQTEQAISQSAKLDELIKLNQTSAINSSLLGYIGMGVEYDGSQFTYAGGQSIQFNYNLAGASADTQVNILNDKNEVVWTAAGDKTQGDHTIVWPGVDKDGKRVAAGAYHIEITAKDTANAPVATTTPVTNFNYSPNTSSMTLKYNLAAAATQAKASVFDSKGNLVWTADVEKTAGDHTVVWPGIDKDGKPVSAGNYTIQVGAKDSSDKAVKTVTTVPAIVSGVTTEDGSVKLLIGDQKVAISTVKSVHLPN